MNCSRLDGNSQGETGRAGDRGWSRLSREIVRHEASLALQRVLRVGIVVRQRNPKVVGCVLGVVLIRWKGAGEDRLRSSGA